MRGLDNIVVKEVSIPEEIGDDKVIETAGSVHTIAQTAHLVSKGGTIVLVGLASSEEMCYNFAQIMDKEAEIKSVFRYRNIYPKAIEAVASGSIDISGIVTHEYELNNIQNAFCEVVNNKTDLIKAIIKID